MAKIICEFDNMDLADLSLGKIRRSTPGITNIKLRQRTDRPKTESLFFFPAMLNNMGLGFTDSFQNGPLYPPVATLSDNLETSPEPYSIRSVVAELTCREEDCSAVTGKLFSYGATQIHVR